jgi:UV DNA damage repair endonuclease
MYGLIGISEILLEQDASNVFEGLTRRAFDELSSEGGEAEALAKLEEVINHNLNLTQKTISHCAEMGIANYRLSNSIFSLASDPSVSVSFSDLPGHAAITDKIKDIGRGAKSAGISLSIHPDGFNSLGNEADEIAEKTIKELNFHAWFLDSLGTQQNLSSPICIEVGEQVGAHDEGEYYHDEFVEFVDRFVARFKSLDKSAQKRLALDCDDQGTWNCYRLFKYFHVYSLEEHNHGFALVYDNLHDKLNPSELVDRKLEERINIGAFHETWGGVIPLFRWSEGVAGTAKHADYLSGPIPVFDYQIKWECDVRKGDLAIARLMEPEEEDKLTEEELRKLTRERYNAIYDV